MAVRVTKPTDTLAPAPGSPGSRVPTPPPTGASARKALLTGASLILGGVLLVLIATRVAVTYSWHTSDPYRGCDMSQAAFTTSSDRPITSLSDADQAAALATANQAIALFNQPHVYDSPQWPALQALLDPSVIATFKTSTPEPPTTYHFIGPAYLSQTDGESWVEVTRPTRVGNVDVSLTRTSVSRPWALSTISLPWPCSD